MSVNGFYSPNTINFGGKIIELTRPIVMGVININNDSFYIGSRKLEPKTIIEKSRQMVAEGASVIDLGAMSTRPGAPEISIEIEKERLVMAVEALRSEMPEVLISIDTYRVEILQALESYKINMVNDISGGQFDSDIYQWTAGQSLPYVVMHMRGTPQNMTAHTDYKDIIREMLDYYIERIPKILEAGIKDIFIDPGIGFAKTIEQNFYLLQHLHVFKMLELPLLVGLSRKSFIWKTLNTTAEHALNGSTAMHFKALEGGAKILRVHDVAPAMETITLWKKLNQFV